MCIPKEGRTDKLRKLFVENMARLYGKELRDFKGFKSSLCGKIMRTAVALYGEDVKREEEILKASYKNFKRRVLASDVA